MFWLSVIEIPASCLFLLLQSPSGLFYYLYVLSTIFILSKRVSVVAIKYWGRFFLLFGNGSKGLRIKRTGNEKDFLKISCVVLFV